MHKALLLLAILAGASILSHAPAHAQLLHSWVASNGSDAANCDRPTPCATFAGAYNKTNAGGEITCVDGGNYGGLGISKALTVNCEAAIGSNALAFGVSLGLVGISGLAASDVVTLRGLDIDGAAGNANTSLIAFSGTGTLRLEKMKIANLHNTSNGVAFGPSGGSAKLHVSDSFIVNNGTSGVHAGIFIQPSSGNQATVMIERSVIDNNQFGIFADGTQGGIIRGVVKDSVVSGNSNNGIAVNTNAAAVGLLVDNTLVSGNNYGIAVAGAGGLALVRRSTITANTNGVATFSSGQAVSYGDNALNNNTIDGAFSFPIGTR